MSMVQVVIGWILLGLTFITCTVHAVKLVTAEDSNTLLTHAFGYLVACVYLGWIFSVLT